MQKVHHLLQVTARGKIFLTLTVYTFLYHLPKFHQIIFHIDKTVVIRTSPSKFPPNPPEDFHLYIYRGGKFGGENDKN